MVTANTNEQKIRSEIEWLNKQFYTFTEVKERLPADGGFK